MKTRVFIADDHGVLRGGLRALLSSQPDMEVVGEAENGRVAEAGIVKTKPDVALMDLSMPGSGGFDAIASLSQKCPRTRVLVLTVHEEPGYARTAMAAGAAGYLVKRAADTELLAAVRAVAQGRAFMDVSFGPHLAEEAVRPKRALPANGTVGPLSLLSGREREVLELVAEGYSNREVGGELGLSVKSVETYRARLMEKLGLCSRSELVRYALECGVLRPGKTRR